MSRTADVQRSIWSDPWFLRLPPDGKLLYLWAFTNDRGNEAGLFVAAKVLMLTETSLTARRLDAALVALEGKLVYEEEDGVVWVVGKAKRVRSKTEQIAKSIAKAVEQCPSPEIACAFRTKYAESTWLAPHFNISHSIDESVNLTRTSREVQGQGQGLSSTSEEPQRPVAREPEREDVDRLCHLFSDLARHRTDTPASASKYRPTVEWRREMRRLLDLDGRSEVEVERVIRWVHADPFWAGNVLSVPTLRRQYDRFRDRALGGGGSKPTDADSERRERTRRRLGLQSIEGGAA